ncbi:MAG: hypothetical protein J7L04_00905 [Bacteroidales bacterium]|nr:hypothetical protein [Bacteroidales bacterium]
MEKITTISTTGHITKVELLHTLKSNILENTFVLENFEPFPGYHGKNAPSSLKPHHLFLVTRKAYSYDEISRTSKKIGSNCQVKFGARPADLFIFNQKLSAIRIKELDSFEKITELQKWYIDEGISFKKKKNFNSEGLIKVMKHFELSEVEDGIYKDNENPLMCYFQVPAYLSWKVFEKITYSIKNNISNSNFDAAQGVIYLKDLVDIVRVYMKDLKVEFLKELQSHYLEEIRKINL